MAIYKRGKTWHTDFSVNGQRYRFSLDTGDWREAQAKEKDKIAEAARGALSTSAEKYARLSFLEGADRFLERRRIEVSAQTWKTETERMKSLRRFFSGMRVHQINEGSIRDYQAHRHANGKHPRTINHEVKLLLSLLRRAKMPRPEVKLLPVARTPVLILNPEEKAKLFRTAASKPEWREALCAALIAAFASLRPKEIRSMRWADVDSQEGTISIWKSKTPGGTRKVPCHSEAWKAVCWMRIRALALGTSEPEHFVFHRMWPQIDPTRPVSNWRSAWRSLRKEAGLPNFRYYDLRHHA